MMYASCPVNKVGYPFSPLIILCHIQLIPELENESGESMIERSVSSPYTSCNKVLSRSSALRPDWCLTHCTLYSVQSRLHCCKILKCRSCMKRVWASDYSQCSVKVTTNKKALPRFAGSQNWKWNIGIMGAEIIGTAEQKGNSRLDNNGFIAMLMMLRTKQLQNHHHTLDTMNGS